MEMKDEFLCIKVERQVYTGEAVWSVVRKEADGGGGWLSYIESKRP